MGHRRAVIRRRVLSLTAGQLLVGGALAAVATTGSAGVGVPWRVAALMAAFAVVGMFPMHLELGRSACTVLLVEAVLVVGFFVVGPLGIALAATLGELAACLMLRLSPLKIAYSAATTAAATLAAALTFAALGGVALHADAPESWLAALAAVTVFLVYNYTATSLVRSVVEGGRLVDVARAAVAVYALSSLLSASVGLITLALFSLNAAAPILLLPVIVIAALETRRAAGHRAEHLRFERLYEASGRTTGLESREQALARSASEARNLVTGVAALCCVADRDGNWTGMLIDDDGARQAEPETVATVVALTAEHAPGEVAVALIGPSERLTLPSCATVVVAGDAGGNAPIALAVFRELAPDDQGDARAEVLAAFVGHATLTAANATLYEDVQDALAHQVDLNRQKDEFAAAVSHELRTPLAAMLTSIATLRRLEGRLDQQATGRVLEMADRQGKRLHRLIDDLLMLAAIEQSSALMQAEPTDVATIVSEVTEEVGRLAPNTMTTDISTDVGIVASSAARLRQVLTNLIENAVKYGGGSRIEVTGRREDGIVVLSVIDHGRGVAEKDTSRVFERFVQLDQSATRIHGGTGLGLHLCRKIAELLDGTLALTATPGGGASFTLSFPAPRLHEASVSRNLRSAARPAGSPPEPRRTVIRRPALAAAAQKG
jgi:signal transduction histidine kinase